MSQVDNVSIDAMIASLLIVGFDGEAFDNNPALNVLAQQASLGGVILFDQDFPFFQQYGALKSKNIVDPEQLQLLNSQLATAFPAGFRSIDVEGGQDWVTDALGNNVRFGVNRLLPKRGFSKTLCAKQLGELYREGNIDQVKHHCLDIAAMLHNAGFNLVYAPVVDIDDKACPIISAMNRSYSSDVAVIVACSDIFIEACAQYGIQCCLKHYPGHGSSTGDTHEGCVDITDVWSQQELEPFHQLAMQCGMVMMSHVIHRDVDDLPASLSPGWIKLLRDTGFDGVIISDDVQMAAVLADDQQKQSLQQLAEVTLQAFEAGNDMVIVGNQMSHITSEQLFEVIAMIKDKIHAGAWSLTSLEHSVKRVAALQQQRVGRLASV